MNRLHEVNAAKTGNESGPDVWPDTRTRRRARPMSIEDAVAARSRAGGARLIRLCLRKMREHVEQ
jgi:hypothetical protein